MFWVAGLSGGALHAAHHFIGVGDHFQHFTTNVVIHHVTTGHPFLVHRWNYVCNRAERLHHKFLYFLLIKQKKQQITLILISAAYLTMPSFPAVHKTFSIIPDCCLLTIVPNIRSPTLTF